MPRIARLRFADGHTDETVIDDPRNAPGLSRWPLLHKSRHGSVTSHSPISKNPLLIILEPSSHRRRRTPHRSVRDRTEGRRSCLALADSPPQTGSAC